MFDEEVINIANIAEGKTNLLKRNPLGYFIASMLAGVYIGFGTLLIFTIGGMLNGAVYSKILMGVSFGIALSLVIVVGAELFTGNNMVMALGVLKRTVTIRKALKL